MGTGPAGPPASTGKGVRGQRGSPKRRRRGQRPRRETVARTVPSLGTGLDIRIRDAHRLPSYLNAKRPSRDVTLKLPGAGDGALGWGGAHPPAQRAVIGLLSRHSPAEKTMSRKAALRPWGRQAVPDGRERRGWPRGPRHEERRKGLVSRRQKDRGTRGFKVTDGSRGLRLFQSRVLNNYSMKILRQKKTKNNYIRLV